MYFTSLRYTSPTFVSSMVNTIASMTFVIALCLRYTRFTSYTLPVKFKSLAFCKRKSKKKIHIFLGFAKMEGFLSLSLLSWNLNQFSSFWRNCRSTKQSWFWVLSDQCTDMKYGCMILHIIKTMHWSFNVLHCYPKLYNLVLQQMSNLVPKKGRKMDR